MKQRLLWGFVAAAVLSLSSAGIAQRLPPDEQNPPWKAELEKKATPRTPDGKPNLVSMWQRSGASFTAEHGPFVTDNVRGRNAEGKGVQGWRGRGEGADSFINFERDSGVALRAAKNKPQYKPEYWDRVQEMDLKGNQEDPEFVCYPSGLPRIGPPDRIIQLKDEFIFLYQNRNVVRIIPMDKKPVAYDQWEGISWLGKPTGHWEGDTLVIESVDFGDHSWLEFPGYVHSNEMRVTERYTRTGDVLKWDIKVDDPEMFLEPWVWDPWYLRVHSDPEAEINEAAPCRDYNSKHLNTERG